MVNLNNYVPINYPSTYNQTPIQNYNSNPQVNTFGYYNSISYNGYYGDNKSNMNYSQSNAPMNYKNQQFVNYNNYPSTYGATGINTGYPNQSHQYYQHQQMQNQNQHPYHHQQQQPQQQIYPHNIYNNSDYGYYENNYGKISTNHI
jgi:hypothetical protein